jgi:sensor histidine kinase YesM
LFLSIHAGVCVALSLVHQFFSSFWCNTVNLPDYHMPSISKLWWRLIHLDTTFVNLIIYWTILGVFYAMDYYNQYRERELRCVQLKNQLNESRLKALKMQIHPHFLYNTLNALSTLVLQNKKEQAVSMIAKFGDFLRMTLDDEGRETIPLAQELEFAQRYLDIQKIRFQDRLTVHWDVQPSSLNALVPNLILQPIVENAVRHAVASREEGGSITLHAHRNNGSLNVSVEDNGPGIPDEILNGHGKGIGLKNFRDRLATTYGDNHVCRLENHSEGGAMIEFVIPYQSGNGALESTAVSECAETA